jgi:hypothetical protein
MIPAWRERIEGMLRSTPAETFSGSQITCRNLAKDVCV